MPIPKLRWGLAYAVPPEATGAWGCRAIVSQDGHADLVPTGLTRWAPSTSLWPRPARLGGRPRGLMKAGGGHGGRSGAWPPSSPRPELPR